MVHAVWHGRGASPDPASAGAPQFGEITFESAQQCGFEGVWRHCALGGGMPHPENVRLWVSLRDANACIYESTGNTEAGGAAHYSDLPLLLSSGSRT